MTKKTLIKDILLTISGVTAFTLLILSPLFAYAQESNQTHEHMLTPHVATVHHDDAHAELHLDNISDGGEQSFTKKRYKIKGQWRVVQEGGKTIIRFSDDFKTKNGPDLKVFLSPQSVDAVTGQTALDGAVKLGVLKSRKGGQDYVVPDDVSLANFSSVLIHCEAFSVLWGGGSL